MQARWALDRAVFPAAACVLEQPSQMATREAQRAWVRLVAALALVLAVLAGAIVVWHVSQPSQAELAVIDEVRRKTGLELSVEHASLDAARGMWQADGLVLRAPGQREPLLRVERAELSLRVADLVRGAARIERASLRGAELWLDLRPQGAGQGLERARLLSFLPAVIEAPAATVRILSGGGEVVVRSLGVLLTHDGKTVRGTMTSTDATLEFKGVQRETSIRAAVSAELTWGVDGLAVQRLRLRPGGSALEGELSVGTSLELSLRGDDVDLADLAALIGTPVQGKGRVEVVGSDQALDVRLDLRQGKLGDFACDRVQAVVRRQGGRLHAREVRIERGDEVWSAGSLLLDDALTPEGTLSVEGLALSELLARAGVKAPAGLRGQARGTVEFAPVADATQVRTTRVHASLVWSALELAGHRFERGSVAARLALGTNEPLVVERLELVSRRVSLEAAGTVQSSGALDLKAKAKLGLLGRDVDVEASVRGTADKPESSLQLSAVSAARLGLQARAELSGATIAGGALTLSNADLAAHLPALAHAGAPHARVSAQIELTGGVIDDLRSLTGRGELSKLGVGYGGAIFESVSPIPIALRDGRVSTQQAVLAMGETVLRAQGEIALEGGVDIKVTSTLPLAPLLASVPFVERVEGKLRVALSLRGKGEQLELSGEAEPQDVGMVLAPLGLSWSGVQGRATLTGSSLRFHEVSGALGKATLALGGTMSLAGVRLAAADLTLALRKLALSPQPRFEVALEADSTLRYRAGDALPVLGGTVTISRMLYARHVQLPEAVIALGRSDSKAVEPTVALDLRVTHRAPLVVRNDFLDVELSMDEPVRVLGTDAQPGALGKLSVTRGRALFRGATLTVRRGVISLTSDKRIVPGLDLLADAPAKRRTGGLIHFEASGDPKRFGLTLRCEADGPTPPPFTCSYAGSEMTCGHFSELTALWACQAPY